VDEIQFGRGIRALRVRRRLTQDELGRAAGMSRGAIARIEQGRSSRVTVATLDRVAGVLGARVICRLTWNGENLDRLLDAAHATAVEKVVSALQAAGWAVATEASFNVWGERGSIDVLAFHAPTRSILVVEVKSVVPDVQAMLAALDRKTRLGLEIAGQRGWAGASVSRLLVILESRTARRRIERHGATFSNAFPDRSWAVQRWIRSPDDRRALRGLWFLTVERSARPVQRVRRPRTANLSRSRGNPAGLGQSGRATLAPACRAPGT
jgi:transcriptional regulator with XRE-family HTH domain